MACALLLLCCGAALGADGGSEPPATATNYDVLVYGATSGGVVAAVAASRHPGTRVGLLVANGGGTGELGAEHIGGMSSSGLGKTDIADGGTLGLIGGIAGEFYSRNAAHYGTTAPPSYDHEPHVAMNTFRALLANSSVTMLRGGHGLNVVSVSKSGAQIRSLAVADGRNFTAEVFIDCSYEGDLLAAAGGSYTVGREAADLYNESMAGRRPDDFSNNGYEFPLRLDPYDAAGQPLPLLEPEDEDPGTPGEGDARVQAYNFRLCATADPRAAMRAPFPAMDPASRFARPDTWELGRRVFADPDWETRINRGGCPGKSFPCFTNESPPLNQASGHKRDWNNPFLTPLDSDCVTGCNQSAYPEASVSERLVIWEAHRQYYLSLLNFYGHDPAVPERVRKTMSEWGLCADEFDETNHWPPQMYVRETRRMVGDRVFTQNSAAEPFTEWNTSIGCGDYTFDSHPAQRFACRNGSDPRCAGAHPPWLAKGEVETRSFAVSTQALCRCL